MQAAYGLGKGTKKSNCKLSPKGWYHRASLGPKSIEHLSEISPPILQEPEGKKTIPQSPAVLDCDK